MRLWVFSSPALAWAKGVIWAVLLALMPIAQNWPQQPDQKVVHGKLISAHSLMANGELIAVDLDQLHISPNIVKRTAVDESGKQVNGRGDKPNMHDILTGSKDDGTAYFPWEKGDHTCSNWTSSLEGNAQVGHHDRHGGGNISWTSAHATRGCDQDSLKGTGGAGLFYCFAAD